MNPDVEKSPFKHFVLTAVLSVRHEYSTRHINVFLSTDFMLILANVIKWQACWCHLWDIFRFTINTQQLIFYCCV